MLCNFLLRYTLTSSADGVCAFILTMVTGFGNVDSGTFNAALHNFLSRKRVDFNRIKDELHMAGHSHTCLCRI